MPNNNNNDKKRKLNNPKTESAKRLKDILAAEKQEAAAIAQKEKKEAEERQKRDAAAKRALAKRAREEAAEERKKAKTQQQEINTDTSTSTSNTPVTNATPVAIDVGQAIQHLTNQIPAPQITVTPQVVANGCGGRGPAVNPFVPAFAANPQNLGNNNLNPNANGDADRANNQQQPPVNNDHGSNANQPRGLDDLEPAAAATGNTLFNLLLGTGIKKAVTGAATTLLTTGFGTAVTYMFGDSNEGTNNPKPGSRILPIGGGDKPVEETKPTPAPAKHECHVNDRLAGNCR